MMKRMARWVRDNGAILAVATTLSAVGGPGVRDAVSKAVETVEAVIQLAE